ncbi:MULTISPECIES: archaetidylserine decarboxylase [unclassified Agarivorans]|uniref:archaetidylserine decarboxylase n=1 Tax=unclassified Agarivorans TaxID=2636026 RepID=UPI0026E13F8B|nr:MULTISPECIES: archaetidylserine decarboxylase [unclassified Agarivorans]MDO6687399.1 archaetidylserine decarboxylase [Agarivorans sp. 3_MG-2023]MDO6715165.1 archaetidylserine decarboxylase [Agarivorans sp. 2_MG-2023]
MLDKIKVAAQYCFPQHGLSRLVGKLAQAEAGKLTHWVIKKFINRYQVDMNDAVNSEPSAYPSFNAFFTRPLKPGTRPLVDGDSNLAHPVDGAVSQLGPIQHGRIIQAKGHDYSARELLGGDKELAEEFNDGDFATIYLAPKDYHRIHMPCKGKLRKMVYVPGQLFSVNPLTAANVPNLFARNERVVAIFDTEFGPMAMVLVGATIVASIETIWSGTVTPPGSKQVFTWDYSDQDISLDKGAEMGRFKLGSTVVMLFAKDAIEFEQSLAPTVSTVMGTHFASKAQ